jgi:hypothetical protein
MTQGELKVISEVVHNLSLINIERTPATLVRLLSLQARDALEKLIKESDKLSNN